MKRVNNEIQQIRVKQERTRNIRNVSVLDIKGIKIEIYSTVEVVTTYKRFRRKFLKSK